jgi:hypothetical protein
MTRLVGVGVFAAIVVAGLSLDLVRRRQTSGGPNFTQALGWLEVRSAGRIVLFVTWSYAGWHFFVR